MHSPLLAASALFVFLTAPLAIPGPPPQPAANPRETSRQTPGPAANQPASPDSPTGANFLAASTDALAAMRARAAELNISGVAVVAFAPGDTLSSWTSRMLVIGRYKDDPTATTKGSNLLAIAYSKAAEMADTHQDSGTVPNRTPLTGEFGWNGGVTARLPSGSLIVAFSGGKSEDDVQVARAGLALLKARL